MFYVCVCFTFVELMSEIMLYHNYLVNAQLPPISGSQHSSEHPELNGIAANSGHPGLNGDTSVVIPSLQQRANTASEVTVDIDETRVISVADVTSVADVHEPPPRHRRRQPRTSQNTLANESFTVDPVL